MSNIKFANKAFENAVLGEAQAVPPVWMMRQAGRYHSHYQALRKAHSFDELCKNPDLAAEVALGPVLDFDFDVSILFSDLLFPLEALGMGLEYTEAGPRLGFQLSRDNLSRLKPWAEALPALQFQKEALIATRKKLPENKSLIGFVGGPWTLYVYAVEGSHAGSLVQSKSQPHLLSAFAETLMPLLQANIELQLEGGAEVVMVFDTAAGELAPQQFQQWVEPLLLKMCEKFPGRLGYYSKGTQRAHFSKKFWQAPWAGGGFDHRWDLTGNFQWLQGRPGFVQGNFDQTLLHLPSDQFQKAFREYLAPFQKLSPEQRVGWVSALGHGILPKTPETNVRDFVKIVRESF
ncbi:MAG: uroporphyrinogen decarboxylase [Bdellovibrio sp. CG10_big_fil_rev_8_21_14_0_10_47_8]|nr:MAG: uroporphyrinogen decarboxylase [Bdellovibrio sp. CG10_big_fil_rev_8_21_14_0_10_47_8]